MRRCSCWVPAVRGESFFFARTHFLACEDIAGGSDLSAGERFFREIQRPFRWVPTVRHFLACEDVAGRSQQSGGESFCFFFARTHFLACEDVAGGSQQSGGIIFFAKYGGPSDGSRCQVEESLFCAY